MIAPAHFRVEPATASPRVPHIANVAAEIRPRFTVDGEATLEEHLALTCDRIADGIRGLIPERLIDGLLLGGGYGRGEGGVWRTPCGDRPYNDLEFYVFLRGNRHLNERLHGRPLHVLGEILTPQAGIEVEFRIASITELAASAPSMFSYDLVSGHRCLIGDETLLAHCAHHANAEDIPLAEATRLLMNRASGLLLAQARLARPSFAPVDADFVARNIAKAQLGIGDAILTAHAQYHWSARERHRRLERLARADQTEWLREIRLQHAAGVEFKFHPVRSLATQAELAAQHSAVTNLMRDAWLWVETRRLGRPFPSTTDYIEDRRDKWPEATGPRNVLVNVKALGTAALADRGWQHPRNRVLTALAMLLWQPDALTSPSSLARLQRDLRTNAHDFTSLVNAYRELWSKVN
jgi:hypothetical protein